MGTQRLETCPLEPKPEVRDHLAPAQPPYQPPAGPCSHLYIHVKAVVEVPEPEEVSETQRDVKGTELPVTQREQPQDVQVVLVPSTVGGGGRPPGSGVRDRHEGKTSLAGVRDGPGIRVPGDRERNWGQGQSQGETEGS